MRTSVPCGVLLAGLLILGAASEGRGQGVEAPEEGLQRGLNWAIGYTVNAPSQYTGVSTVLFGPRLRDWGLYLDYKWTRNSPADGEEYLGSVTMDQAVEEFNGRRVGDKSVWRSVNVAAVRALSPGFAVYAGAGLSQEKAYRQFFDSEQNVGNLGYFWVDNEGQSGSRVNLLGGVWLRATPSLLFQFGAESAPSGITVGGALVLPVLR